MINQTVNGGAVLMENKEAQRLCFLLRIVLNSWLGAESAAMFEQMYNHNKKEQKSQ